MAELSGLLAKLPDRHKAALEWFFERTGMVVPWPDQLPDGSFLASRAKGIFKPAWSHYALSVKQTLKSPYEDKPVESRPDGTWRYGYYPEAEKPGAKTALYTNAALDRCLADKVPVGVLKQVNGKPNVRYLVLGVALVERRADGYYLLEGFSPAGKTHEPPSAAQVELEAVRAEMSQADDQITSEEDARTRGYQNIVRRQGQPKFRRALLEAYAGRCCVTGCDVDAVLEAAHIRPYNGPTTDVVTNGLLLRGDIHTLFDLRLIAVDTDDYSVVISPALKESAYAHLHGVRVRLPANPASTPSKSVLDLHRELAGL